MPDLFETCRVSFGVIWGIVTGGIKCNDLGGINKIKLCMFLSCARVASKMKQTKYDN